MAHLQSLSFLKNEETCDFGHGAVAMQVGMFSGCSIHTLCRTPAASSFSARFFSCVSPFTSSVTYTQKRPSAQLLMPHITECKRSTIKVGTSAESHFVFSLGIHLVAGTKSIVKITLFQRHELNPASQETTGTGYSISTLCNE